MNDNEAHSRCMPLVGWCVLFVQKRTGLVNRVLVAHGSHYSAPFLSPNQTTHAKLSPPPPLPPLESRGKTTGRTLTRC